MLLHVELTVAAIIQGVAFAELVRSDPFVMLRLGSSIEDWLRISQVAATFLVLVVVWFAQIITCIGFALWPRPLFGFLDALLPLALGATEVKLIQQLDKPQSWCLWAAGFFAVVFVGWVDLYRKMGPRQTASHGQFGAKYTWFKRWNISSSGACCLAFAGASRYRFAADWTRLLLFAGFVVLGVLTAISLVRLWNDLKVRPVFGGHHLAS